MGILDSILKNPEAFGNITKFASENPEITKEAMSFLSGGNTEGGGLNSILESLRSEGLGDVVSSWLGKGENLAVPPDKLESAMNSEKFAQFTEKAGVTGSEATAMLAGLLPQLVDKASPEGQLPDNTGLEKLVSSFFGSTT